MRPTTGRAGRPVTRAACALVATLALATPGVVAPTPASAAEPLGVTLNAVTVSGSSRRSVVTVSGTVTNTTAAPAFGVQAALWRSDQQIKTLSELDDATTKSLPEGRALSDVPGELANITIPTMALAPQASAPFTVSATLDDLGIDPDASYVVGANVSASTAVGGPLSLGGSARSIATVPGEQPPAITRLITLSDTPRRLRPNLFTDDSLASGLSGRLAALVSDAASSDASWVVDPSLVDEATDMADGYRVLDGTGASHEGTGKAAAQAWLASFKALPHDRGYQMLYGDPDLAGSTATAPAGVLSRALDATKASGLDLPILATTSRVSPDALVVAARAGVPVVSTGAGRVGAYVTMAGSPVVVARSVTAPADAPLLGGDSPLNRSALLLANARISRTQVRIIDSEDALAQDKAATMPGAGSTALSALLTTRPLDADVPTALPLATGAVTPAVASRLDATATNLATYGSAAPTSGIAPLAEKLASNAASEAWLTAPDGRTAYLDALDARSGGRGLAGLVTISATPRITMSSDTSRFPATVSVARSVPDPLTLRVVGDSSNGVRMHVNPSQFATIKPGDSDTITLDAAASANGVVDVDLHAETPDGRVMSDSTTVALEATSLGRVGWIIVIVSGLVLVISTAVRIRQVRARQGRNAVLSDPTKAERRAKKKAERDAEKAGHPRDDA